MKSTNGRVAQSVERRFYTPEISATTTREDSGNRRTGSSGYRVAPVGKRFGRWTVLGYDGSRGGKHHRWWVRCDCGLEVSRQAHTLATGASTQCAVCNAQAVAAMRALPVPTRTETGRRPEYRSYMGMLARCYDESSPWFARYGGRGIGVCERWRESFANFYHDVGPRPRRDYSIDRIDNDGDYEPGNVRWASAKQQARNTRRNRVIKIDGRAQCVAAWAEERGVNPQMIFKRMRLGWSERDAVMVPPGSRRPETPNAAG